VQELDAVGGTSLWVAAGRAIETERTDALFHDPFARELAGEEGLASFRQSEEMSPHSTPIVPVRTRYFDDVLLAATAGGVRQIVILAAGMDARAYRIDWPEGTTVYEIDRGPVLERKGATLSKATPRALRRAIVCDLAEDWITPLTAAGFDRARPAAWLIEGITLYLEEADLRALLARVDALSARGSVATCDVVGTSLLRAPSMKPTVDFMAAQGSPWRFGTDTPEALFTPLGWEVEAETMSEVGTRLGRWPFPNAPRGAPGVPHSFLVRAEKPAR
jgi:methyltransferase (TIGR00027 family)